MTLAAAAAALAAVPGLAAAARCDAWPAWSRFKDAHLSADGRVIDYRSPARVSSSEGQAYALLFALIARDRPAFDRILEWTANNLARGDLTSVLPAWQWGRRADGDWGVLDANPAADADVWLSYALLEAGRLWNSPAMHATGAAVAARILREEVVVVPGVGAALLPAPFGFADASSWRLNPSYWPLQVLRGVGRATGEPAWQRIGASAKRLILTAAASGHVPDWITVRRPGVPGADEATDTAATRGSYGAIRVYLWAGMLARGDPDRAALVAALRPLAVRVARDGVPPEWFDAASGAAGGDGPAGFSAALVPLLATTGFAAAAARQHRRALEDDAPGEERPYYDDVLRLFGLGWDDRRYRFDGDGRLQLGPERTCGSR